MFFHETVNQRNHVVISYRNTAIIFYIFITDLAFIIHNKFRGKSVPVHIMIITYIILRKDKRHFTWRKQNFSHIHVSILICCRHIINADHNISLIIHTLRDLIKFINRCHNLVIIPCFIIPVKCLAGIFDQCMVENMCHLI